MKPITIVNGSILTPSQTTHGGTLVLKNGKIDGIYKEAIKLENSIEIDATGLYIAPGFIDIHLHGGGGYDFMDNTVESFLEVAKTHAQFGTTSMVPTTLTSTKENLIKTLETYEVASQQNNAGANFLGVHIEGPYFSMSQRGAQDPKYIRLPDAREYLDIINRFPFITRWSAAPELEGALKFGQVLKENNILASVAHTEALYTDIKKAHEIGFSLMTHLYSGMLGVVRKKGFRYAGAIESAFLIDDMDVEIIADAKHLPVELLQLVYKIKGSEHIALITDAMRAAGTPLNTSKLGNLEDGIDVIIEDGVAKLPDRLSFAGSIATTDQLVRNMVHKAHIPLQEAVKMMSSSPARIMNVHNKKGKIERGYDADIIIFNENIDIFNTIVEGKIVYQKYELAHV